MKNETKLFFLMASYFFILTISVLDVQAADISGSCGTNADNYFTYIDTWPSTSQSAFCSTGTPSPVISNIYFPAPSSQRTWECLGEGSGSDTTCVAERSKSWYFPTSVIDIPTSDQTILAGDSVYFSGHGYNNTEGAEIIEYEWRLVKSGGTSASYYDSKSFSHKFDSPGLYVIALRVKDNYEHWTIDYSTSVEITVEIPTYSCAGSIPDNATACRNTTVWEDGLNWHHVSSCIELSNKCEYRCNSNYNDVDGECLPNVYAECGNNSKVFSSTYESWPGGAFCSSGMPSPSSASISFPAVGSTTTWRCLGLPEDTFSKDCTAA